MSMFDLDSKLLCKTRKIGFQSFLYVQKKIAKVLQVKYIRTFEFRIFGLLSSVYSQSRLMLLSLNVTE